MCYCYQRQYVMSPSALHLLELALSLSFQFQHSEFSSSFYCGLFQNKQTNNLCCKHLRSELTLISEHIISSPHSTILTRDRPSFLLRSQPLYQQPLQSEMHFVDAQNRCVPLNSLVKPNTINTYKITNLRLKPPIFCYNPVSRPTSYGTPLQQEFQKH